MKYDFETVLDRSGSGSIKWAEMRELNPDLPPGIIPFSVADMELKNAPEIMRGLREYLDENKISLGYTFRTQGYLDAVSGWMKRRHGWDVDMDWLVMSPGVVTALYCAVRAYTEPGEGVIIFTPVYYPFMSSISQSGRVVVDVPLVIADDRYEIDWDGFEAAARDAGNKLLIFCSPHNPVGRVWTREELARLSDICLNNNVFVISDEIHNDLVMPGHKHTIFSKLSDAAANNSLICSSPSKTFSLAGLQTSNLFVPDAARRKQLQKEMSMFALHTLNAVGIKACEIAYNECEEWLDQAIGLIERNARFVNEFMMRHIPRIKVFPLEGTYLQWWDCRELFDDHLEMESFMQKRAFLFLDEGYIFGDAGRGFERINLACPTSALEEALGRLASALGTASSAGRR
ncbi:MAG: pyridoxal phosphate-dependent aminotransferase [Oscillospiraceae bacterium]|nr:pyridoxal phosphate-dependent aminotransferase [Oscillospiraceae bacterium]